MPTEREITIAGIGAALGANAKQAPAEFTIGNTNIKIDNRGISIILNEKGLDQFALRIYQPHIDASAWGYVLVAEPGVKPSEKGEAGWSDYHVVGFMPKTA